MEVMKSWPSCYSWAYTDQRTRQMLRSRSSWPTAAVSAGHEAQIVIVNEAVDLMKQVVADNVLPVGWPPFLRRPSLTRFPFTFEPAAPAPVGLRTATWRGRMHSSPVRPRLPICLPGQTTQRASETGPPHCKGMIQADGEGFYEGASVMLALE
jgi:hypothetical protein